jgi:hypothetical protein
MLSDIATMPLAGTTILKKDQRKHETAKVKRKEYTLDQKADKANAQGFNVDDTAARFTIGEIPSLLDP